MKINVTNFSLADHMQGTLNPEFIYPALQEFKKLKVPVNVAYNTVKSIGAVEKALKEYDDTRKILCEGFCEKDKDGKPATENNAYKFTEEGMKEFNQELIKLLDTEVSIDIWPVNQKDLDGIKEINIACYETLLKYGFIKDETAEVKPSMNGKADKKDLAAAN